MTQPHPRSQHMGQTWLEPEELAYPNGAMRRRALVFVRPNPHNPLQDLPIGSLRIVRCGIPDTHSSIPARMMFRGKSLKGYVSVDTSVDMERFTFTPEADPGRCPFCQPDQGCKRGRALSIADRHTTARDTFTT